MACQGRLHVVLVGLSRRRDDARHCCYQRFPAVVWRALEPARLYWTLAFMFVRVSLWLWPCVNFRRFRARRHRNNVRQFLLIIGSRVHGGIPGLRTEK